jgi:hypothetical protein
MDGNHCTDFHFKFAGSECRKQCYLAYARLLQGGTGVSDEHLTLLGFQASLHFKR